MCSFMDCFFLWRLRVGVSRLAWSVGSTENRCESISISHVTKPICVQYTDMPALPRANDLRPDVSRRLRAARAVVYDTAAGCARVMGIPKNTWLNYEIGKSYPDPAHLVRFCDVTGFTTDFIYRGRFRGIVEDVQIRLAADHPELVDEAPDVVRSAKGVVRAS